MLERMGKLRLATLLACLCLTVAILVVSGCGNSGSTPPTGSSPSSSSSLDTTGDRASEQSEQQETDPLAEAREFYKNKTIQYIVPYSVGGGFDKISRLLAPEIEKRLEATVVVRNVTGAGGLVGTNELYNSKPDGLTIGIINAAGMILNQIMGEPNAKYDMAKFDWLGRLTADNRVLVVGGHTPYHTIDDLRNAGKPIRTGVTGKGSDDFFTAALFAKGLGFEIEMITGYDGQADINLAVARGDLESTQGNPNTFLPFIDSGDMRPIGTMSFEKEPRVPDAPVLFEGITGERRELLETTLKLVHLDRSVTAPPGVEPAKLQLLRETIADILTSQEFLDIMTQSDFIPNFLPAEEVVKNAQDVVQRIPEIRPILEEALQQD